MTRDSLLLLPVVAATAALFWIVPELPFAHLDNPSHWGLMGYALTLGVIAMRVRGRRSAESERRWMVGFLVALPLLYVANWTRFGGGWGWLGIEMAGVLLYGGAAWFSVRRWPWLLPAGIAGHALWDAAHYDVAAFVPNWFAAGCIFVDAALGLYVAGCMSARNERSRGRPSP